MRTFKIDEKVKVKETGKIGRVVWDAASIFPGAYLILLDENFPSAKKRFDVILLDCEKIERADKASLSS